MERIAFLLEETGERLSCMLNPESLVVRRLAGLHSRRSMSGVLTVPGMDDDQLLYTGGGMTEIILDILFDVSLAGSSITTENVRELTAPLWNLAENGETEDGYRRPPLVRLVWGKSWNIPGIVAAVAERLEYFTAGGAPRRSWMRMRFLRVREKSASKTLSHERLHESAPARQEMGAPLEQLRVHRIAGGGLEPLESPSVSGEGIA